MLPSGFYYEKTELLSQEVFSAMLCIFFKSACIKSASRHSVIHVFFIKIPPHYCRRSRLWSMTQNRPLLGNAWFSLAARATLLTALKWAWYRVSKKLVLTCICFTRQIDLFFDILKHKSSFLVTVLNTSCYWYGWTTSSPAPPGVPELKLHPVMVKLWALLHHPVSQS